MAKHLPPNSEVILVENGSSDGTRNAVKLLQERYSTNTLKVVAISSEPGLGSALRAGISITAGTTVIFMADDLPFGVQEILIAKRNSDLDADYLAISKYIKGSVYQTSKTRKFLSMAFTLLRNAFLHIPVRDTQGSFIARGDLIRKIIPHCRESGFLITTELCLLFTVRGMQIKEVPCIQDENQIRESTVRLRHVLDMLIGFRRLAQQHKSSNYI